MYAEHGAVDNGDCPCEQFYAANPPVRNTHMFVDIFGDPNFTPRFTHFQPKHGWEERIQFCPGLLCALVGTWPDSSDTTSAPHRPHTGENCREVKGNNEGNPTTFMTAPIVTGFTEGDKGS